MVDPQQVLPLAIFALESQAFSNLKRRDDASLDLLAGLSRRLRTFVNSLFGIGIGGKQIDRARWMPFEAALALFESLHDIPIRTNTSINIREIGGPIMTQVMTRPFTARSIRHK
jgi:hypothetical protein